MKIQVFKLPMINPMKVMISSRKRMLKAMKRPQIVRLTIKVNPNRKNAKETRRKRALKK
jgi:hypothetical protein